MRTAFLAIVLAVAMPLLGGTTLAQERFGGINGIVTDESGAVLPGATVTITSKTTGAVRTTTTNSDGSYNVQDLEPGRYSVIVELMGFAKVEHQDVNVLLGRALKVDAGLKVGDFAEVVNVTAADTPAIDTRSTLVAHNVTAEEIQRMPKGRSFQSLALTAPSVNEGQIEGGIQVNGASGAENSYTVDGVVTNSLINGQSRQNTVFEYLQEVQVKTTGIGAEYGGALGGVISAVTKSGGNQVRGEVHYFYEGSALAADPVKRLVLDPADDVTVRYIQDDKQPDHRSELGGSIGGPIIRDRMFYFGSYSPRVVRGTNDYLFSNGAEPGQIDRKQTLTQAFGKVTFAGSRFTASGSLLYTPTTSEGFTPAYNGSAPQVLVSSLASNLVNYKRGFETTQTNTSGTVDVTLTNSSFLSVRGGYFYDNYRDTNIPDVTNYIYQTSSVGMAGVPANIQGPINTQNTPRVLIVGRDATKRGFVNVDYNHNFALGGNHSLKGGVGYQRTVNEADQAYPGGYVNIYWDRNFVFGGQNLGRGAYGYYEVNDRGVRGTAGANIISLYAQDQWSIGTRLTLNLGVRTENEVIPSFKPDILENAIEFGMADKIAPRLGASYDVHGDGRFKVFGSWGRYFDWTKYELARGSYGGDTWLVYYRGLDSLDISNLNLGSMPGRDLWVVQGGARDRRVPNFQSTDPNIKPMYQDSTSLGAELQLGGTMVFGTHYVHNILRRTIEDIGGLDAAGNEVYIIGNPGEGLASDLLISGATPFGLPMPKPKRQYDAVQLTLNRRFANNYFWSASYVWSRLYGNYTGIASSDEVTPPTTNTSSATAQQQVGSISRPGGNANRAWDIDELLFDSHGNIDPQGNLPTDRPHVVKLYGGYTLPWGTQLGGFFYGGSGTPLSTYVVTVNGTYPFVEGRGDMGRTDPLYRTDLLVSQEFKMGPTNRIRLELNVLNLFNQQTSRHRYNWLNRGGGVARNSAAIDLTNVDLTKGYDYRSLIASSSEGRNAYDPRYGMDDLFSPGTQGYFTVKFLF